MPLIQVKAIEGVFDADEKRLIIERLTDAIVSVEGEALRAGTWVTFDEVASGDWGMGGKVLHTSEVLAKRAGS
jgi:4-oxalocrotonate tautomerase